MRFAAVLVLVSACSDPARQEPQSDAPAVIVDAPPAGPIDFTFFLPGDGVRRWCLVRDRAALGLHQNPETLLATSTDEWCSNDTNCDGICAAFVNLNPPNPVTAEFFIACDPVRMVTLGPSCAR